MFLGPVAGVFGGVAGVLGVGDAEVAEDVLGSESQSCSFVLIRELDVVGLERRLLGCPFARVNLTNDSIDLQSKIDFFFDGIVFLEVVENTRFDV